MARLLIVFHSRTGGSRQMAEAAAAAVRDEVEKRLLTADNAGPDDLLQAKGYLFWTPENLAAISGVMKEFYDGCYSPSSAGSRGGLMPSWSVPGPMAKTPPPDRQDCQGLAPARGAAANHRLHACAKCPKPFWP